MKRKIGFVLGAFGFALLMLAFTRAGFSGGGDISPGKKNIIPCRTGWDELARLLEENEIPPIPGAGEYSWKITTQHDSAQFYFNQGINMYYAFHIIESMASFKKAARFDPSAAMLHWAQALAYGPNINDLGYAASPDALEASLLAMELSGNSSRKEKMLIRAQAARYSPDSMVSRESLNQLYADKMKEVYEAFPGDADVAALYVDALMLQHPWDLWTTNGEPKPWTPLIRNVLEKLLAQAPGHPGANHYYIHVMEASPFYRLALPSADRLGSLTPGLSHTVHMPSHIYLRAGQYDKGSSVNEDALSAYNRIIPLFAPVTANAFLYAIHNLHMQTNNAILAGRFEYSVGSALQTVQSIPAEYLDLEGPLANYIQNIHSMPLQVNVRFGKWDEILASPRPESRHIFLNVIYHFSRGMAYAGKNNAIYAKQELDAMKEWMQDSSLHVPLTPFSAAIESAEVGRNLLAGRIAMLEKDHETAIQFFREAVRIEELMVYNEPRDWILNPGQYLGAACLAAGQLENARRAFEADLERNNENPWSLYGLWEVHTAEKNPGKAKATLVRLQKAGKDADITFRAAVY